MVLVRTVLQELALRDLAPGACLAEANRQLIARNPLSLFVAVIYGIMDSRSGLFTFCSGGHVMPYVLRGDRTVEIVAARAAPLLGLIDEAVCPDLSVSLNSGDGLLLITDGVTECFNAAGEAFGEDRLMAALAASRRTPRSVCCTISWLIWIGFPRGFRRLMMSLRSWCDSPGVRQNN
jgi:serine phosphatase RsbU (regulator of sigma subunit)